MHQHNNNRRRAGLRRSGIALAVLSAYSAIASAEERRTTVLPSIEVVGTTPLPGLGVPIRDMPANVQIYYGSDVTKQKQSNLGEYLEDNPTSVTINSAQGNPFQADINFRGFTASPLLGTPQGLSVFQDGVRINEPFGDVVNWDLIPQSAIGSLQLIPGSNPAFGLNTLGGAISIETKNGIRNPGIAVEALGGSFGRKGAQFEAGGKGENLHYFVTGNYLDDHGWAQHNASTVKQAFGKLGWQDATNDIELSLTAADNALEGTQTLPLSFFDNIRQPYTFPDRNTNKLTMLSGKGTHALTDDALLGGNLYYRKYKNSNFSSNVNDNFDPEFDPVQATNDRSSIDQDSYGLGIQLALSHQLASMQNQLTMGASADFGRARFTQDAQTAEFAADRGTVATSEFSRETDAKTTNRYYGVFIVDTLKLDRAWTLTASGRYNVARVKIEDQSGSAPELNGDHKFTRFNPAVGLNYSPSDAFTGYATYNEGMRAPTPIELTCADPNAPCKLPNNFLADPPLKKVVSKTIEAGARGKLAGNTQWTAAVYRSELRDDIQFISAGGGATNAGYFQNVGKTRRDGIELSLATRLDPVSLSARYSYTNATYLTPFSVNSPNNSSADPDTGNIIVGSGNRIPGIPQHSIKLRVEYGFGERASIGTNLIYSGSVYARGDENNRDINGKIPGYTVVNLDGHVNLSRNLQVFARVANLFDRKYANFGTLGENFFTGPGNTFGPSTGTPTVIEQFRAPGAPRGAWLGVRYSFGG